MCDWPHVKQAKTQEQAGTGYKPMDPWARQQERPSNPQPPTTHTLTHMHMLLRHLTRTQTSSGTKVVLKTILHFY